MSSSSFARFHPKMNEADSDEAWRKAWTPGELKRYYGWDSLNCTGKGQRIAIVCAFHAPHIQADLDRFCVQFELPKTQVRVLNATKPDARGPHTAFPPGMVSHEWAREASMDLQWAHAMAPEASLIFVEAHSNEDRDLADAIHIAAENADIVSMSFGCPEPKMAAPAYANFHALQKRLDHPVVFVAASGDRGMQPQFPSTSADVISVGGSVVVRPSNVNSDDNDRGRGRGFCDKNYNNNNRNEEEAWRDSGGGESVRSDMPDYQRRLNFRALRYTGRLVPDCSMIAAPESGCPVAISAYASESDACSDTNAKPAWCVLGGTSLGTPILAGVLALVNQTRSVAGKRNLCTLEVLKLFYAHQGQFSDIKRGASEGTPTLVAMQFKKWILPFAQSCCDMPSTFSIPFKRFTANSGFDLATGLGSPTVAIAKTLCRY